ncbi:MAG: ABC transporter permease [Paracoccus sp. (in: a-proteobacteria)]|jgi:glycine betaine/proline transport system permease protein|uniref:ABC transporter permease n=1 Tax=unclassified Paracoccus (in: a-proteobacteria) TaxID=2688777 RepID=UPI0023748C33|nr:MULTISPECIES: proline/glycine betaine ABC transporter permease [unclassified Paracoccus (in: a-proteobacteria)]MCS5603656.1 proline/glycine betaine ABC transporter permease [Paracoccus sp. (in: a-proteobacteria)]MDB2551676.1 proline/glycine betaine ABC transporter permease [Paracoccus sp. (in: a-proteobacteria)]|tara:strand:+ start:9930 stop:10814 length:885 start_codon:yes stop_codon:yes gene_type:complete
MDFVTFPSMSRGDLRAMRIAIDGAFRDFTRAYGETLEQLFQPIQVLLIFIENLLIDSPWILVLAAIGGLVWGLSRSWKIVGGTVVALLLIGFFGMWEDTMRTIAMVTVCTLIAVVIGIPIGILMARSERTNASVTPILDMMQTMPSFVYLIPVVMIFGLGKVPGVIAVVIYAVPPVIRLTNLGIRQVPADVLEAAEAFGSNPRQKLQDVQLPLALPTIMAGVNQTIMMSLAMVVVASMIGVRGLGQPVLQAINNQYFTLGVMNGLAIVAIAIIFDRATQAYGKRLQRHLEAQHG